MKYILITGFLFMQFTSFSQDNNKPVEVTIEIQKKIRQEVLKEIPTFKQGLDKGGYNEAYKSLQLTLLG